MRTRNAEGRSDILEVQQCRVNDLKRCKPQYLNISTHDSCVERTILINQTSPWSQRGRSDGRKLLGNCRGEKDG